jgi:predicted XRE-type DNA-binding protein
VSKFLSVWDAIEEGPAQAEVMKIRSDLMRRISQRIADEGWGPEEAEARCGLTVTGLTALLAGMIEAFSLEDLIRIGVRVGLTVRIAPEPEGR